MYTYGLVIKDPNIIRIEIKPKLLLPPYSHLQFDSELF